jgi:hypothetical protein
MSSVWREVGDRIWIRRYDALQRALTEIATE